jgi:hypothetical protein
MRAPFCQADAEPPALDLDRLMAELRAEVEARRSAASRPPTRIAGRARCDAKELLALPEAEFVGRAYVDVLGREPSVAEAARAVDRLLMGEVRPASFLDNLVRSEEGRARRVEVVGLREALLRERPEAGALVRLWRNLAHGARTAWLLPRRIHQFVRRVDALEKRVADQAMRLEALERRLDAGADAEPR